MELAHVDLLTAALPAPWLPPGTPVQVERAIARARYDLLRVVEIPLGSNRSPDIDDYNTRAGAPLGSYWCASAASVWWEDAGLPVPPHGRASCDQWMAWAHATGRWSTVPELGAMVLYGMPGDAKHIGMVCRVLPLVLSAEGNTTIESGFNPNGIAVAVKIVDPKTDPILGYVLPFSGA